MKKLLLFIAATVFFCTNLNAQQKTFLDVPYIEVSCDYTIEVMPDIIYMRIILVEGEKYKGKIDSYEEKMINALEELKIDVTNNLSVSDYMTFYSEKGDPMPRKEYKLKLDKPELVDKAFRSLARIGITDVNVSEISHSNMQNLRVEAQNEAIKLTKKRAEELTEAIGQKIGPALLIQPQMLTFRAGGNYGLEDALVIGYQTVSARKANAQLKLEKLKITQSVSAKYMLQQ